MDLSNNLSNKKLRIFEVGPRDGLQNEPKKLDLSTKVEFIENLLRAGLKDIEVGAFVRPDRVPQMADSDLLCKKIQSKKTLEHGAKLWCLVPNEKGLERALAAGMNRLAVFTAASESFNQRNIGMSISDSLQVIERVVNLARTSLGSKKLHLRAYISTAFGCPFEGKISPKQTLKVLERLAERGIEEISIGDTIGVATPNDVEKVIRPSLGLIGAKRVAVHFHDTRGTALANTLRSIDLGVRIVDSSAGGLGGCPFAPGATGNLATEDLVYMLDGIGAHTGVQLDLLCKASLKLAKKMNRPLSSRYLQAFASTCKV